jgi:hypothetical protein
VVIPVLYAVLDRKEFMKAPLPRASGGVAHPATPPLALRKQED